MHFHGAEVRSLHSGKSCPGGKRKRVRSGQGRARRGAGLGAAWPWGPQSHSPRQTQSSERPNVSLCVHVTHMSLCRCRGVSVFSRHPPCLAVRQGTGVSERLGRNAGWWAERRNGRTLIINSDATADMAFGAVEMDLGFPLSIASRLRSRTPISNLGFKSQLGHLLTDALSVFLNSLHAGFPNCKRE